MLIHKLLPVVALGLNLLLLGSALDSDRPQPAPSSRVSSGRSPASKPAHARTGSAGYLANRGSVALRAQRQNTEPLVEVTRRA